MHDNTAGNVIGSMTGDRPSIECERTFVVYERAEEEGQGILDYDYTTGAGRRTAMFLGEHKRASGEHKESGRQTRTEVKAADSRGGSLDGGTDAGDC